MSTRIGGSEIPRTKTGKPPQNLTVGHFKSFLKGLSHPEWKVHGTSSEEAVSGRHPNPPMNRFLSIETSGDACSVSLIDPVGVRSLDTGEPRSHARLLVPLIQELLQEADGPLDGVCVDMGPGSYTGLRIGVSTAKGLAWSLGCPLYAISSLELLASAVGEAANRPVSIRSLLPARGEAVYTARFHRDGEAWTQTDPVHHGQPDELTSTDPADTILVAPPDMRLSAGLEEMQTVERVALHSALAAPLLRNLSERFRVETLSAFEPLYVQSFVARKPSVSIFDRLPF